MSTWKAGVLGRNIDIITDVNSQINTEEFHCIPTTKTWCLSVVAGEIMQNAVERCWTKVFFLLKHLVRTWASSFRED
jgi:hypothetical protein